jgi:uncharacterized lipoprotein YbaY
LVLVLDRLLRRFVRVTYTETPVNPPGSTVTVHLTARRWMPRRVVLAVAADCLDAPARLLTLERSWLAGQADAKWALTFDRATRSERNDHGPDRP